MKTNKMISGLRILTILSVVSLSLTLGREYPFINYMLMLYASYHMGIWLATHFGFIKNDKEEGK